MICIEKSASAVGSRLPMRRLSLDPKPMLAQAVIRIGALMRLRVLNVLAGLVGLCAGIGSPIAILLLLLAFQNRWWRSVLDNLSWMILVLVLIVLSRFVVGGIMHYETRKYIRFLHSPEGVRRRAQEVQESINALITEAKARPSFKPDPSLLEGFPPGSVMTEARRLARNIAKDELRRRGIKLRVLI